MTGLYRSGCRGVLPFISLSAYALTGCSTLVNGTEETFHVATNPPGATVRTTIGNGNSSYGCASTPCGFNVSRKATFVATIEKDGYHPVKVIVRNSEFRREAMNDFAGTTEFADYVPDDSELSDVASAVGTTGATVGAQLAVIHVEPLAAAATSSTAMGFAVTQGLIVAAPMAFVTDSATGSLNNLYPNPVAIQLVPDDHPIESVKSVRTLKADDPALIRLTGQGE